MTRESCISHPAGNQAVFIDSLRLEACKGSHCAAFIMCLLQSEVEGHTAPINFKNSAEIERRMFGLYSERAIKSALSILCELGFLSIKRYSHQQAFSACAQKTPQRLLLGDQICGWCNSQTLCLEQHHYPVPRSKGGDETVGICASCHAEFHFLTGRMFYEATEALYAFVRKNPFPDEVIADLFSNKGDRSLQEWKGGAK